jgi:hypothetical protein
MTREASRIDAVPLPAVFASGQVYGRPCNFHGVGLKESTGAASVTFNLRDGSSSAGSLVLPYTLTAGQSVREWLGTDGVTFEGGLFLEVVSGSAVGSVFLSEDPGEVFVALDLDATLES